VRISAGDRVPDSAKAVLWVYLATVARCAARPCAFPLPGAGVQFGHLTQLALPKTRFSAGQADKMKIDMRFSVKGMYFSDISFDFRLRLQECL
jgi:hypothetical protein